MERNKDNLYSNPRFVKWVGGKNQLLSQFEDIFPKQFNNYVEPFVGSGSVFFHMLINFKPKKAIINDLNVELITTYKVIRDKPFELIDKLKQHKEEYLKDRKEYFYKIRALNPDELNDIEMSARFIFLNKTCFNGMYRVNKKGGFNVPIGSYKNPDIVQEDKILFISKLLNESNVEIYNGTYNELLEKIEEDDFVYMDPPYHPLNEASFTSYTKYDFDREDQKKLKEFYDNLHNKKCKVMKSNSDTDFIKELYKDYNVKFVQANRMINSKAEGRGKINEIVILNY